jgi:hypothetical protein
MIIFETDPETKALGVQFLMNPADYNNHVKMRRQLQGKSYKVIPDNEGPLLEFLQCYTYDEKQGASFHQEVFDEMIREKWRKNRAAKLQTLDTQYIIALERNDTDKIVDIVRQKTILRDITKKDIPKWEPFNSSLREYMLNTAKYIPEELK